jgi:hypothetical protein
VATCSAGDMIMRSVQLLRRELQNPLRDFAKMMGVALVVGTLMTLLMVWVLS